AGFTREAESVLRKAVQFAPKQWKCRVALGRFLDWQARLRLSGMTGAADTDNSVSGRVAQTRRALAEAGECFDKAVSLAPDEGEVYFRRGMHRSLETMLLNQIRM